VGDGQLAFRLHAEVFAHLGAGHLDGGGPGHLDGGGGAGVNGLRLARRAGGGHRVIVAPGAGG